MIISLLGAHREIRSRSGFAPPPPQVRIHPHAHARGVQRAGPRVPDVDAESLRKLRRRVARAGPRPIPQALRGPDAEQGQAAQCRGDGCEERAGRAHRGAVIGAGGPPRDVPGVLGARDRERGERRCGGRERADGERGEEREAEVPASAGSGAAHAAAVRERVPNRESGVVPAAHRGRGDRRSAGPSADGEGGLSDLLRADHPGAAVAVPTAAAFARRAVRASAERVSVEHSAR